VERETEPAPMPTEYSVETTSDAHLIASSTVRPRRDGNRIGDAQWRSVP